MNETLTPADQATIDKATKVVNICIESWDWPDGVTVEFRGIQLTEVWDMECLMVGLGVTGTPADGTDDRADLEEMLDALTNHLDTGGRMSSRAVGYDR